MLIGVFSSLSRIIKEALSFFLFSFFFLILTLQELIGRFARLADTPEGMAAFRAKYRILDNVELQHCELGEWLVINKPPKAVVIPMIAFIEGGMEIPMGRVTRDFLINFWLSPTQYSPNLFMILGSVDMINQKMGTNLTWHDVNWVYNSQKGKRQAITLSVEFLLNLK